MSITRFTACAEISLPGDRKSLIYGTVIPWDKDKGPCEREGLARWEEHRRQVNSQSAEWVTLGEAYPDHFQCIAGDFNQHRGEHGSYRDQQSVQVVSRALEAIHLECVTVDPPGHESLTKPLVDHVCLSRRFAAAAKVTVLPFDKEPIGGLSDHHLVVVDIDGITV